MPPAGQARAPARGDEASIGRLAIAPYSSCPEIGATGVEDPAASFWVYTIAFERSIGCLTANVPSLMTSVISTGPRTTASAPDCLVTPSTRPTTRLVRKITLPGTIPPEFGAEASIVQVSPSGLSPFTISG